VSGYRASEGVPVSFEWLRHWIMVVGMSSWVVTHFAGDSSCGVAWVAEDALPYDAKVAISRLVVA